MTDTTEPGLEPEAGAASIAALDDVLQAAPAAPAPKAKEPKTEAAPEAKPETQEPFWYRQAIKKEKQAREAAERRAAELEQAQGHTPRELPHPGQDPQGFYSHFETQRLMDRLERSEDRFIDKHGEQEFEATKDWLATRPDIEAAAMRERHPWAYAHTAYQRERLAAEIGDDPSEWRKRQEAEIRARIEAEFEERGYQPAPGMAAQPRLPTAAASARSAGPKGGYTGPAPLNSIVGPRK